MSQRVVWIIVAAVVIVSGLAVFGVQQYWERARHHDEHMAAGHAGRAHEDGEEHNGEAADGHAGHAHEDGEQAVDTDRPPSGVLVDGVRVVKVTARQYEFDPETIVVRAGESVRLEVTSEDVTHGMNIEAYGIDGRIEPDETEIIEFTADRAGRHHFHCSVYCGAGHDRMGGELIVLPAE